MRKSKTPRVLKLGLITCVSAISLSASLLASYPALAATNSSHVAKYGCQNFPVSQIVSKNSGKVLDVSGASIADGAPVIQYHQNNGANQAWSFEFVSGNSKNCFYKIRSVNSGKLLDVNGASMADGAQIIQYHDNGGQNQVWDLISTGQYANYGQNNNNEVFKIVSANSGKLLDVNGASMADGAPIIQYYDNGGQNQLWSLIPVNNGSFGYANGNHDWNDHHYNGPYGWNGWNGWTGWYNGWYYCHDHGNPPAWWYRYHHDDPHGPPPWRRNRGQRD